MHPPENPGTAVKRVVLCRPQGPRNVGSVLRAVLNFGPAELWIVGPVKPSLFVHPDFVQMAHGVPEVEERVRLVDSIEEALADCTASYGFTARPRGHRVLRDWRALAPEVVRRAARGDERIALVFGNEEAGLSNEEAGPLHELARIPTGDEHDSLNLALAAGIVLSHLFLADAPEAELSGSTPLSGSARAFLVERLKRALGERTWSEPARRDLAASIERVFSRAPLETRDARAWHLLARALGNEERPRDYGLDELEEPAPGERSEGHPGERPAERPRARGRRS